MKQTSKAFHILQYGFVALFIWFGLSQLLNPSSWVSFIPTWATGLSGMSAHTLVIVNGIFEVVAAALVAFDIWVPIVASLLAIHLLFIVIDIGITPIGVRDLGLVVGLAALAVMAFERE
jgi:uncharacterized membrane protein YphA (DoxX/SURF4 family)